MIVITQILHDKPTVAGEENPNSVPEACPPEHSNHIPSGDFEPERDASSESVASSHSVEKSHEVPTTTPTTTRAKGKAAMTKPNGKKSILRSAANWKYKH
ncbi:hypothetical protein TIFTF001_041801 [Ficus carica]|uniref:Uncharacterized protein n=1 Tax=Ficus carica TaxID=3494 RepID=A0AA88A1Y7_FICCA|nr:hypothetical protein TIFTF001_041801 [Ficus carica]